MTLSLPVMMYAPETEGLLKFLKLKAPRRKVEHSFIVHQASSCCSAQASTDPSLQKYMSMLLRSWLVASWDDRCRVT